MTESQQKQSTKLMPISGDPAQQALSALWRMGQALTTDDIWEEAYSTLRAIAQARIACFEANARELLSPVPGKVHPQIDRSVLQRIADASERSWFRQSEPSVRWMEEDHVLVADCADSQGLRGAIALVFDRAQIGSASTSLALSFLAAGVGQALGRLTMQVTTVPLVRHNAELERSRVEMSRALHDGPAQDLSMASMALDQVLKAAAAQNADGLENHIALEFLERAIVGLRRFISELRGEDKPFAYTPKPAPTLVSLFPDDPQEQAILAITREALRNARKHANADVITVTIRRDIPGIEVQITDDGAGFAANQEPGHFGLTQMSETASDLGGTLSIESVPGAGTTVRFVAPAPEHSQSRRSPRDGSSAKHVEKRNVGK
jgi:signal transduction histidine kinase